MRKHNGMRPQDIVVLLKIIVLGSQEWQFLDLSRALYISPAEISESLHRSSLAGLIDYNRKRVNKLSFFEFLQFGLRYVFPQAPGRLSRGMATAHSHPVIKQKIVSEEIYVWPDVDGEEYGQSIEPLYPNQIKAAKNDPELYAALAMLDVIRTGKSREIKLAFNYLSKLLRHESSD